MSDQKKKKSEKPAASNEKSNGNNTQGKKAVDSGNSRLEDGKDETVGVP